MKDFETLKSDVLKKAVEKAKANGWDGLVRNSTYPDVPAHYFVQPYEVMIYSHSFAKALWGDKWVRKYREEDCFIPGGFVPQIENWKYHLQKMVVADEPIQYLGENL